jgi:hypothetical protein
MNQQASPEMVRVYFAVRLAGKGGYLNEVGQCVDRGPVCSTDRAFAESAALACVSRPAAFVGRGRNKTRVERRVEIHSALVPAVLFPKEAA